MAQNGNSYNRRNPLQLKVAGFCIIGHQRVKLLIVFQMDIIIYK